jgi:hypothetical protein
MPAGASLGTASWCGRGSGWDFLDVDRSDPVDMALAADLQWLVLARVAESACKTYTCQLNMFVAWCGALAESMMPLLASIRRHGDVFAVGG